MKIIFIGLDSSVLEAGNPAAGRLQGYAARLDSLAVVMPAGKDRREIRGKLSVYGVGGRKIWAFLKMYFLLGSLINRDKPDVISVQDQYYLALLGLILARRYGLGWEMQVHGFEKMSGLRSRLFAFLVRRADAVRTVSRRLENILVRDFRVGAERITVVPVGVERATRNAQRGQRITRNVERGQRITRNVERVTHNEEDFVFLSVGRLVEVKRFDLLINAFADVCGQMTGARLLIAGEGPERRNLGSMIQKRGVADRVELLGWRDDLSGLYAMADAFVLASDSEGWGMAVVEAMGHGLPIIMTDVGLAGEVVVNEESGLVVPAKDQAALSQAVIRIYQDRDLRQKLSQGAIAALAGLPSEDETWELYLQSWRKADKNFLKKNFV